MKITFLPLLLGVLLLYSACQKKQSGNTSIYMTASITPKSAGTNTVIYDQTNIVTKKLNRYLSIDALNGNSQEIQLVLKNYTGIGTYQLDSSGLGATGIYTGDLINFKKSLSGTVIITNTALYIIGTYSFTCVDSTVVSEGRFEVLP